MNHQLQIDGGSTPEIRIPLSATAGGLGASVVVGDDAMAGAAVPAHADGHAAAHGRPAHVGRPRRPRVRRLDPLQAAPVGKAIMGRTPLSHVGRFQGSERRCNNRVLNPPSSAWHRPLLQHQINRCHPSYCALTALNFCS